MKWTKEVQLKDGTKVLLRPEVKTDLEMLWNMYSTLSEESLRFLLGPITRKRIEDWIENLDYDKVLPILAVVRNESGRDIVVASATLSFSEREVFKHKAEFSIVVHDDYQDKGLGTQLTQHMIDIAREKGLKKVSLNVFTNNERAIHIYKKCGFKIEGLLEKEHYKDGEYSDDYLIAILL